MANDSKSSPGYLNKLIDEYNNTYHYSVRKKPIYADNFALPEESDQTIKFLNLKLGIESRLLCIRTFLAKVI